MTIHTPAVLSHLWKAFFYSVMKCTFIIWFPATDSHNLMACQWFKHFVVVIGRRNVLLLILDSSHWFLLYRIRAGSPISWSEVHQAMLEYNISLETCVTLASLRLDLNCHMVTVTDWVIIEYWWGLDYRIYHATANWVSFFFFLIYLFYLFLVALGLRCCARAFSSCVGQGLLFVAVRWLLIVVASLVAEHGL